MTAEPKRLQRPAELGQPVWIDYLARELPESGELARLVRGDAVVGVTSNPTIVQQGSRRGDALRRSKTPTRRSRSQVRVPIRSRRTRFAPSTWRDEG